MQDGNHRLTGINADVFQDILRMPATVLVYGI